jgi:ABC-type lipoprotein export system ATPase subunit
MFHLVPYLDALDNVLLAAAPAGTKPDRKRTRGLLGRLGLGPRVHHKPAQLSTGERQRTALARALFNQPQLVLADEPTGNLDPANATGVFDQLQTFHRTGGTVLVVTHGSAADAYADRVIELSSGAIRT